MKVCKNCGNQVEDNESTCKVCGATLNEEANQANIPKKEFFKSAKKSKNEQSNSDEKKYLSKPARFYKNLCFYLKFTLSPIILAVLTIICVYGVMLFDGRRRLYIEAQNETLRQSSVFMIIIFSFFLALFLMLLILSIYLNIKKFAKKRNN